MKVLMQRVRTPASRYGEKCRCHRSGPAGAGRVEPQDDRRAGQELLKRLLAYRVFSTSSGKMNRVTERHNGGLLLVSQFTLAADTRSGGSASPPRRRSAGPALFEHLVELARTSTRRWPRGRFGADMQVQLVNDGR